MKIKFAIELIFGIAVALGITRWIFIDPRYQEFRTDQHLDSNIILIADSLFCGFGLVLGFGTWVEKVAGKSPASWGVGRKALAIALLYMVFESSLLVLGYFKEYSDYQAFSGPEMPTLVGSFRRHFGSYFSHSFALFAGALAITDFATNRKDSERHADQREWTGRFFILTAAVFIASYKVVVLMKR